MKLVSAKKTERHSGSGRPVSPGASQGGMHSPGVEKEQMKIAILTEILSTHSGSRAPIELAKHLSSNNEITLLAYSFRAEKNVQKILERLEVKVVLIDVPKIPLGKWLAVFKFLPRLKGHEIISFHGTLPAFLIAKLSGLPLVKTYYGTQLNAYLERLLPHQKLGLKDKFLNWSGNRLTLLIQKIYFNLSDQVVAISQYTTQEAQRLYRQKIPFIYLAADSLLKPLDEIPPARWSRSRPPRRWDKQAPTLLSVSRLTPYKGFHLLIEAVKKTGRQVNLFLVGSTPQPKYLDYIEKIKTPQAKILVDISDQELASLYQNCDLYASCDRYLFFGLPPLEAALFGKPSIILDHCAAREIVNHQKTGLVAKNLDEFTQYLKTLIDQPKLRAKMGREAKTWAQKNFSWQKTAQEYQKLFAKTRHPVPRSLPIRLRESVSLTPKERLKLLAVVTLGFLLRLLAATNKDFWFDEAISWAFAKQNLPQMLTATAADNHPPLYYLFLHFWLKFGQGEVFLRLPSIFFGTISIYLVYLIGKRLFNQKTALFSSLLLALSPLHLYFSAETRMYSLWTMLILIAFYYFLKILAKPARKNFLLFTFYFLLSLYTHYFSLFLLLIFNLFLFLQSHKDTCEVAEWRVQNLVPKPNNISGSKATDKIKRRPRRPPARWKARQHTIRSWLLSQAVITLSFLPWALVLLVNPHPHPWQISPLIGLPATFLSFVLGGVGAVSLKTYFAPTVPLLIKGLFIFIFTLFTFFFLLGSKGQEKKEEKKLLLLLIFFPILAVALISLFYPLYFPRSFLAFSPYFYLLTARGIEKLSKSNKSKDLSSLPIILITIPLISIFLIQNFYPPFKSRNLKKAAEFIVKKDAAPVIVHTDILTFYPFSYYLREKATQYLLFSSELTKKTTDIIGGSPVSLDAFDARRPFWSVTLTWDEKTRKFKEEQSKLRENYQYELVKTINDMEIFHYQPRSPKD